MASKVLNRLMESKPNTIDEILDETDDDNGYWIYLKRGWATNLEYGRHSIHEDTVKGCLDVFKSVIECECEDCISGNGW